MKIQIVIRGDHTESVGAEVEADGFPEIHQRIAVALRKLADEFEEEAGA